MAENTPSQAPVLANPTVNELIQNKEMTFRFKKDKMDYKRPNVELKNVPLPSVKGVAAILNKGGKGADLLMDAVYDVVRSVAAGIVAEDKDVNETNFPWAKISWDAIANMEKADRRSTTISDETWADFAADYMAIMPGLTNKGKDAIALAVECFTRKLTPVKSNKEVLAKLQAQLAIYMENSKKGDEFSDILELLIRRLDNYMKADEPQILAENL